MAEIGSTPGPSTEPSVLAGSQHRSVLRDLRRGVSAKIPHGPADAADPRLGASAGRAPNDRKASKGSPSLTHLKPREEDAQGALDEYHEYLRLEPFGSMAPAVRQVVEKLEKTLHS